MSHITYKQLYRQQRIRELLNFKQERTNCDDKKKVCNRKGVKKIHLTTSLQETRKGVRGQYLHQLEVKILHKS